MAANTMLNAGEKRKCMFKCLPPKRMPASLPRAADIKEVHNFNDISQQFPCHSMSKQRLASQMPAVMKARIGEPTQILAIDIETHDWLDGVEKKGRIGQFGWYTMNADVEFARIVQIAWVIKCTGESEFARCKSHVVRPDGFDISERATRVHGISTATAAKDGCDLADILQLFITDVLQACANGAKICAHQFEFDAGVIAAELQRLGMLDLRSQWMKLARSHGFCTMNPTLGRWLMEQHNLETKPYPAQMVLGLQRTLQLLRIASATLRKHNALDDAKASCLIYERIIQIHKPDIDKADEA